MPEEKNRKYWAFISYSSKDREVGDWLHKRMENYSIPDGVRGATVFDGSVVGRNLRPVFKDREELSGCSDLGTAIEDALSRSRFLVVVCTPNSAKSKWVDREIETFVRIHGPEHILAVVAAGEPNSEAPKRECFPPSLKNIGNLVVGDIRKGRGDKERGFLKILSGIVQLDFDALYRRHENQQARKRFVAWCVAASVMCLVSVLSLTAFYQKNMAVRERNRFETSRNAATRGMMLAFENVFDRTSARTYRAAELFRPVALYIALLPEGENPFSELFFDAAGAQKYMMRSASTQGLDKVVEKMLPQTLTSARKNFADEKNTTNLGILLEYLKQYGDLKSTTGFESEACKAYEEALSLINENKEILGADGADLEKTLFNRSFGRALLQQGKIREAREKLLFVTKTLGSYDSENAKKFYGTHRSGIKNLVIANDSYLISLSHSAENNLEEAFFTLKNNERHLEIIDREVIDREVIEASIVAYCSYSLMGKARLVLDRINRTKSWNSNEVDDKKYEYYLKKIHRIESTLFARLGYLEEFFLWNTAWPTNTRFQAPEIIRRIEKEIEEIERQDSHMKILRSKSTNDYILGLYKTNIALFRIILGEYEKAFESASETASIIDAAPREKYERIFSPAELPLFLAQALKGNREEAETIFRRNLGKYMDQTGFTFEAEVVVWATLLENIGMSNDILDEFSAEGLRKIEEDNRRLNKF